MKNTLVEPAANEIEALNQKHTNGIPTHVRTDVYIVAYINEHRSMYLYIYMYTYLTNTR